jgi:hypothetical protein
MSSAGVSGVAGQSQVAVIPLSREERLAQREQRIANLPNLPIEQRRMETRMLLWGDEARELFAEEFQTSPSGYSMREMARIDFEHPLHKWVHDVRFRDSQYRKERARLLLKDVKQLEKGEAFWILYDCKKEVDEAIDEDIKERTRKAYTETPLVGRVIYQAVKGVEYLLENYFPANHFKRYAIYIAGHVALAGLFFCVEKKKAASVAVVTISLIGLKIFFDLKKQTSQSKA